MDYGSGLTEGHLGELPQTGYALGQVVQIHEEVVVPHVLCNFKCLRKEVLTADIEYLILVVDYWEKYEILPQKVEAEASLQVEHLITELVFRFLGEIVGERLEGSGHQLDAGPSLISAKEHIVGYFVESDQTHGAVGLPVQGGQDIHRPLRLLQSQILVRNDVRCEARVVDIPSHPGTAKDSHAGQWSLFINQ